MNEEMQEVVVMEKGEVQSLKEIQGQVQIVQEAMKSVMKKGCHYDTIPGCGKKPVLLKPGSEVILSMFRIGADPIIEDLSDGTEFRYRVKCRGFYIPTGNTVGYGVGECSTAEKKYAWRAAVCDEEYDETVETHRRKYWSKGYNDKSATCVKQIRQTPADIANTVLKMAKKRAQIDLCLTTTACSDIFVQDLDEEAVQENARQDGGASYRKPQAQQQSASQSQERQQNTAPAGDCISENQAKRLFAIVMGQTDKPDGYTKEFVDAWLFATYGINRYEETKRNVYEEICNHVLNTTIPAPGA